MPGTGLLLHHPGSGCATARPSSDEEGSKKDPIASVYSTTMTLQPSFQRSLNILKALIEIESVNPTLVAGGAGERRIAEHLLSVLHAEGIAASLEEVCPGRFNVVAQCSWRKAWTSHSTQWTSRYGQRRRYDRAVQTC